MSVLNADVVRTVRRVANDQLPVRQAAAAVVCLYENDTSVLGFVTNNNAVAAASDFDDGRRAASADERDATIRTVRWRCGPPLVRGGGVHSINNNNNNINNILLFYYYSSGRGDLGLYF